MQPIRDFEQLRNEALKEVLASHSADRAVWEASRAVSEEELSKAVKDGKDIIELTAAYAQKEAARPTPPRIPRLLYGDVTSEKLTRDLATNWPSAGIVSSEAGSVFGGYSMGRDSAMRTMSALNTLWDGGTLTVDRATSDGFQVRNARLTVGLQVQPDVLSAFMDRDQGLSRGSGFLARFLICAASSTQGERDFEDPPPNWPSLDSFNGRIAELLSVTLNIDQGGGLCLPLLDFTPEAKAAWVIWHNHVEHNLGPTGQFANVRDLASKAADNIARLAALFHIYEYGALGAIGPEFIEAAAPLVLWHLQQGRSYLGALNLSPDMANAALLDRWLIDVCRRDRVSEGGLVAPSHYSSVPTE